MVKPIESRAQPETVAAGKGVRRSRSLAWLTNSGQVTLPFHSQFGWCAPR
jgi:hypothetical protein